MRLCANALGTKRAEESSQTKSCQSWRPSSYVMLSAVNLKCFTERFRAQHKPNDQTTLLPSALNTSTFLDQRLRGLSGCGRALTKAIQAAYPGTNLIRELQKLSVAQLRQVNMLQEVEKSRWLFALCRGTHAYAWLLSVD